MAKQKTNKSPDSVYILKLVLFIIVGSQWLYIGQSPATGQVPIPIGLILGLIFASHEHFKIDRKIEYAVLVVAMFIGFWLPMGITITN